MHSGKDLKTRETGLRNSPYISNLNLKIKNPTRFSSGKGPGRLSEYLFYIYTSLLILRIMFSFVFVLVFRPDRQVPQVVLDAIMSSQLLLFQMTTTELLDPWTTSILISNFVWSFIIAVGRVWESEGRKNHKLTITILTWILTISLSWPLVSRILKIMATSTSIQWEQRGIWSQILIASSQQSR